MIGRRTLAKYLDRVVDTILNPSDKKPPARYGNPVVVYIVTQIVVMIIKKILEDRGILAKFQTKIESGEI